MTDGNPNAPAGWYPQSDGTQRYWDGTAWTDRIEPGAGPAASDDKTLAVLSHVLNVVATVIGPLIIYLIKKDESPFVRRHSAEALNFGITLLIAYAVAGVTTIILIGLALLPLVFVAQVIFTILAAMAAGRGEDYRYPVNLRLVN